MSQIIAQEFEELSPLINGAPCAGYLAGKFWAEGGRISAIEIEALPTLKNGQMIKPAPILLERPSRWTGKQPDALFSFYEAAILDHYGWEVEMTGKYEPRPVVNIHEYL